MLVSHGFADYRVKLNNTANYFIDIIRLLCVNTNKIAIIRRVIICTHDQRPMMNRTIAYPKPFLVYVVCNCWLVEPCQVVAFMELCKFSPQLNKSTSQQNHITFSFFPFWNFFSFSTRRRHHFTAPSTCLIWRISISILCRMDGNRGSRLRCSIISGRGIPVSRLIVAIY